MLVGSLDVEVDDVEGVGLDEVASWFDDVAHEDVEEFVGADGVVDDDLAHGPGFGVHGGVPQLFGVHLTESFVALEVLALASEFEQGLDHFGESGDLDAIAVGHQLVGRRAGFVEDGFELGQLFVLGGVGQFGSDFDFEGRAVFRGHEHGA